MNGGAAYSEMFGGDLADYNNAMESGTEIEIDTRDLVRVLSKGVSDGNFDRADVSDFVQDIRQHDMTGREAKQVAKDVKGEIEDIRQQRAEIEADIDRLMSEAETPIAEQVEPTGQPVNHEAVGKMAMRLVETRLRSIDMVDGKKIGKVEARQNAAVIGANISAWAKRFKIDPQTMINRLPTIIGEGRFDYTEGMIERLRANKQFDNREKFGDSLVDFIVKSGGLKDSGGKLKSMGASIRRGLLSKKGRAFDKMAEAAAKAGYDTLDADGRADGDRLLNLVRDELTGKPSFSAMNVDQEVLAIESELGRLAGMIERAGVDLNTASNAEVMDAINALEDEGTFSQVEPIDAPMPDIIEVDGVQRHTLNSNGKRIAQTEKQVANFWRWFGDSKVVDDEGRPLVVYHGTNAEFGAFETGHQRDSFDEPSTAFYFTPNRLALYDYNVDIIIEAYLRADNILNLKDSDGVAALNNAVDDGLVASPIRWPLPQKGSNNRQPMGANNRNGARRP